MVRLVRYPIAFILAVLVAEVLGAIFQVQGNIEQQFEPLGVEVSREVQLNWTLHDIVSLIPAYAPLLAAGFLIAFIVAAFVVRATGLRVIVFTVAGAVAVLTIFLLAKPVFWQVTPIYGARDLMGMSLQAVAGAAGGFVFAMMTRRRA